MSKFEIFEWEGGGWGFRLKSANGKNVGPGQVYPSVARAIRGAEAHRRAAVTARIVVLKPKAKPKV